MRGQLVALRPWPALSDCSGPTERRCEYLLRVQTRGRTGETLSWRLSSPTRIGTARMDEGYFEAILMIHLLGSLDASSMTECTIPVTVTPLSVTLACLPPNWA